MSRILVTGGAGFIGSQFGHVLDGEGHEVVLVDNMSDGHLDNLVIGGKRFGRFVELDVRAPAMAQMMSGVDTVLHFAGTSSLPKCQANPGEAYDNNVTGVVKLLELARREGVRRFIFASTSAVYENTRESPFREDAEVAPDLVYALTKQAAERACIGFAQTCGMDIAIVRFFNVYGEHQDIHRKMPPFVSYLAREVFFGRRPLLYNASEVRRDYVYVGDVIACLKKLMSSGEHFSGEIFNICSGVGASVPEIVAIYASICGKPIDPDYADPAKFWDKFPELAEGVNALRRSRIEAEVFKQSIGDPRKAEKVLGFKAAMPLDQGLRRFYAYSAEHMGNASVGLEAAQ